MGKVLVIVIFSFYFSQQLLANPNGSGHSEGSEYPEICNQEPNVPPNNSNDAEATDALVEILHLFIEDNCSTIVSVEETEINSKTDPTQKSGILLAQLSQYQNVCLNPVEAGIIIDEYELYQKVVKISEPKTSKKYKGSVVVIENKSIFGIANDWPGKWKMVEEAKNVKPTLTAFLSVALINSTETFGAYEVGLKGCAY